MEPEEVRAEIERRKKRAVDLRVRETLWDLYYGRLSQYPSLTVKDPARVYPDFRASFSSSILPSTQLFPKGTLIEFRLDSTSYQIFYREGPEKVRDSGGREFSRHSVKSSSMLLRANAEDVFGFDIRRSVRDEQWGPIFDNSMGEITCFIEGPWVEDLADLLTRIKEHENRLWDERDTPRLEAAKKRFGL